MGWASIADSTLPDEARVVHKAVLSMGWNPTFTDVKQRTIVSRLTCMTPCDLPGQCPAHNLRLHAPARDPTIPAHSFAWPKPLQEAYLCHDFGDRDFYGSEMKLIICAFLRPQLKFDSFDDLIQAITDDVTFGEESLDAPVLAALREDPFFHSAATTEDAAVVP